MPSPGEDIQSWSTVAANNGAADPLINWAEGQARASVNNSSRSEMAAHAKNRNLLNGSIVTTGSANAQQFLSGLTYTSIPTGLVVRLKIGAGLTNTGPATLNMDGIGAVAIKTTDGVDALGGELVGGDYADLLYNGTNWIFLYSREFFWERVTGGGGIIVGKQIFKTPGTFSYTPTPGTECAIVECIGSGAGGGGGFAPGGWGQGGAGGGSGGYSRSVLTAAQIGASQTVTVGAGGLGGSVIGPQNGGNGANTSFGSLVIAGGGGGGMAGYGVQYTHGGFGAPTGTGDVAIAGSPGEAGGASANVSSTMAQGGSGGPGPFGGGGTSQNANGAIDGDPAPTAAYGGGGAGGVGWNGATSPGNGGNGAGGLCIVTEFGGRGAPGRDGAPGAPGPMGPPGPAGSGTGDVLVSGTPAAGQIAEWVDTSHIRGIAPPTGFSTGDAKLTLKTVADAGWLMMNDQTIGSTASGAVYMNANAQDLFMLLFNNILDAWAPLLTSTGAASTRASHVNAAAAWAANCRMTLPRQLGRSLLIGGAGAGLTSRPLGANFGAETHVQTQAEMAAHLHDLGAHVHWLGDHLHVPPSGLSYVYSDGTISGNYLSSSGDLAFPEIQLGPTTAGMTTTTYTGTATTNSGLAGSNAAMDIMNPSAVWNIMIRL